jgi:membrane associated rhomboid family serine protease
MTEFRQTRFEILPPVIKNLIIINVLVFIVQRTFSHGTDNVTDVENLFALHAWQSPLFKPWQFITYLFLHGSIMHILFNMYALWMFGSILENLWGAKKFLIFYFVCGFGAALCHMTVLYFEMRPALENFYSLPDESKQQLVNALYEPTLGASGAIFGCLAAFGYLFPNNVLYLMFIPVPIKAKWAIIGYIVIELYLALQNSAGDNVAHVAHLGGAIFGLILVYFWNKNNRRTF